MRICAPLVAGLFAFFGGYADAGAAPHAWTSGRFVYATNGSGIVQTLNLFAADEGLSARVDGNVQGVVSGRFALAPRDFLDTLGNAYGFVWYVDGAILQISPASAETRIAMRPNYLSAKALRAALVRAGVTDPHFPLELDGKKRTVSVRGPRTYVARIRVAAAHFEHDAARRVRTTVRIFRLSFARAADESRVVGGRPVVVPGAATLLKRRFHEDPLDLADSTQADAPGIVEFDAPLPTIEADAATNSILIRDKPERIDGDGMLVSDLDILKRGVTIEASVVDVSADADAGAAAAICERHCAAKRVGHKTSRPQAIGAAKDFVNPKASRLALGVLRASSCTALAPS
ncbi:hypothetical protein DWV00_22555 [Trinickia dinghuensis]|uniref:Type II/III secretion system family protein n=1 Tax=Trinickia dinghuensis TaxID=2291023 RepID=A0A3D8JUJ3_9BURK|nr:hypothetical protein DWV00_22555 [Trinickia dinghuensis]